ncbi:MAG: hypothetical protein K2K57_01445 [Oscillospiraceae bacterium]|nr:hypothetical protein [Oscillospiraceae bacterium]
MSFIAGYLMGLEDSGGDYKNESKTIEKNGEYSPDEGVRWDKVTVNVGGQSADIVEIVKNLPVYAALDLGDGYRIDFSVDLEDIVPVQEVRAGWGYWFPNGGGNINIYPSWRQTVLLTFAKVYKDGKFLFARFMNTDGNECNKQENYAARDGWSPYLSSKISISDITGMTAKLTMSDPRGASRITVNFNYKKNWISYIEGGVYWGEGTENKSGTVYFNDISAYESFPCIITGLGFREKAKALAELHVALIHTMGYEIQYDISNV